MNFKQTTFKSCQDTKREVGEGIFQSEITFFRVIALFGFLVIPLLAVGYWYWREGEHYAFYPMLVLGFCCGVLLWLSYKYESCITHYTQQLLYFFILSFSLLQVYNCYMLDFPTLDTVTSISNIFILGAILNNWRYMTAYMLTSVLSFLVSVYLHPDPIIDRNETVINTSLGAMLAFVVYYNKIHFQNVLEQSRERLEESENRFRTVFDSAPIGITVLSRKGGVVQFNEAVLKILGFTAEEYLEKDPKDFVHPDDYESVDALCSRIISSPNRMIQEERRYFRKDGSQIWTNVMFALNEKEDEIIITNEDITARMRADIARKAYNERLKQSNEALEHFSYVISHDLQEPLRMITMYTQRIQKKYLPQIANEEATIDMGFVVDGAKRMSKLIKDLLEYSRVSAVESIYGDVVLEDVLLYVKNDLSVAIEETETIIKYTGVDSVPTNQILLKQVFYNLISNSIKYKHPERTPVISIDCRKEDFDFVFTVRDNGIGFEAEYNKRIFLLFQRLHHRDTYTGTGIGLAICQKSVQQMGGKIWADGKLGAGSTFYFTIPAELELVEG